MGSIFTPFSRCGSQPSRDLIEGDAFSDFESGLGIDDMVNLAESSGEQGCTLGFCAMFTADLNTAFQVVVERIGFLKTDISWTFLRTSEPEEFLFGEHLSRIVANSYDCAIENKTAITAVLERNTCTSQ